MHWGKGGTVSLRKRVTCKEIKTTMFNRHLWIYPNICNRFLSRLKLELWFPTKLVKRPEKNPVTRHEKSWHRKLNTLLKHSCCRLGNKSGKEDMSFCPEIQVIHSSPNCRWQLQSKTYTILYLSKHGFQDKDFFAWSRWCCVVYPSSYLICQIFLCINSLIVVSY